LEIKGVNSYVNSKKVIRALSGFLQKGNAGVSLMLDALVKYM
jgi:hypothetical protein